MMSNETRGIHELSATILFGLVLFVSAGVPSRGGNTTNDQVFQITGIHLLTNHWAILTWEPTSTNRIFGLFSADDLLSTSTAWIGRVGRWGDASGAMCWTDTAAEVDRRFYKAIRIRPTTDSDWDEDGLPDIWEADNGLNGFDAGDAHADSDHDGVDNLTEYYQGRDPTRPAVADTGGLVRLHVFTPLE
jgi:hypothetical protein